MKSKKAWKRPLTSGSVVPFIGWNIPFIPICIPTIGPFVGQNIAPVSRPVTTDFSLSPVRLMP